jgi:hypothetical protein
MPRWDFRWCWMLSVLFPAHVLLGFVEIRLHPEFPLPPLRHEHEFHGMLHAIKGFFDRVNEKFIIIVVVVADGMDGVEIFVVIVKVDAIVWQRVIFRVNHFFGIPQWVAAAMAPHFFR